MSDPWQLLDGVRDAGGLAAGLGCAAKAAGILGAAALATAGCRRRAAATRHLIWCLGLAGALLVLPVGLWLPRWGLPVLTARPEPAAGRSGADQPDLTAPTGPPVRVAPPEALRAGAPVEATAIASAPVVAPARPVGGSRLLLGWAAGTMAVLAWSALGWATTWRLGRRAVPITEGSWTTAAHLAGDRLGWTGRVRLLRGEQGAMPMTWGVCRPVVLLPAEADTWPAERRRAVLLHELAHVRRRDGLTQWLAVAACAAHWFNPLAWWAAGRLRVEREQACDDLVLAAGERPTDYAAQLLGVARSLRSSSSLLAPAAMAMARPSGLESRLRAILDRQRDRRGPARRAVVASLLVVLGGSATLGAVRLVARAGESSIVRGQVVAADGTTPLAGAGLTLIRSPRARPGSLLKEPTRSAVMGRGRTDAGGHFRIDQADPPTDPEDIWLVVATAPDAGFAVRKVAGPDSTLDRPIRLAVEQPVTVQLADLQGVPLAGARVRLLNAYPTVAAGDEYGLSDGDLPPALAVPHTTDAAGRFELRGLQANVDGRLEVQAPGFGTQRVPFNVQPNGRSLTLTLGRARVLEGRVTLGDGGTPAVGAQVQVGSMSSPDGMGQTLGLARISTDADGRYRGEVAPGTSLRIEVAPPQQGADEFLLIGRLVDLGERVTVRADFALPRGVLARGRVVEAGTGRGVAGAFITHYPQQRDNPFFIKRDRAVWFNNDELGATTAADGTFRLAVMPGPGTLLVKGPSTEYQHAGTTLMDLYGDLIWPNNRSYPDGFRRINPRPDGGPVEVELALQRGVTLSGHLVGPDGAPERDAVLFGRWYLPRYWSWINYGQNAMPLRGDRFELAGCPPDATAPVFFLDRQRQRGAMVELAGKQAGQDLEVMLQPCGSATVRVVDAAGKPLRKGGSPCHVEVVLTPGASWADLDVARQADKPTSPVLADAMNMANLDRERYQGLELDAAGRITFPTLIPGATYRAYIWNQPQKTQVEFTVAPGEAKDLGSLVVTNVEGAG